MSDSACRFAHWRPNTARNRYLALKRFLDWLAEEGLTEASPVARTRRIRRAVGAVEVLVTELALGGPAGPFSGEISTVPS